MTNAHYENFPVASPLLPAELRAPVRVIYAFARSADDLADEGDASASERIAALNAYERELDHIDAGRATSSDLFQQLALTLKEHHLNTQLLRDLLSAFRQDVVQTRYASFDELSDYCSRSANPVGRIMLAFARIQRWVDGTQLHEQQSSQTAELGELPGAITECRPQGPERARARLHLQILDDRPPQWNPVASN